MLPRIAGRETRSIWDARLARTCRRRRRRFGAARASEPVHLADHCVAGDAAEFRRDLRSGEAVGPQLFQQFDAFVSPAHSSEFLASTFLASKFFSAQVPRQPPRRKGPDRIHLLVWATTGWPDAYTRYRFTQRLVRRTKYRIQQSKNYIMSRVRRKSPQAHVHTFKSDARLRQSPPVLDLRVSVHAVRSRPLSARALDRSRPC